jgi:putative SOS response-associated peptidase YedK
VEVRSLTSSPVFRDALATGRCLIPATGFYEWRATGPKDRQPMHIRSWENEGPALIAAVAPTVQVLE